MHSEDIHNLYPHIETVSRERRNTGDTYKVMVGLPEAKRSHEISKHGGSITLQGRQCTYNVTFMKPLLLWKSSNTYFCVCVCMDTGMFSCTCSLTNSACNAPPYCHLWVLAPHFQHYHINGTVF
jgi:hypothetical protein